MVEDRQLVGQGLTCCSASVVATGVDPVTSRFSGRIGQKVQRPASLLTGPLLIGWTLAAKLGKVALAALLAPRPAAAAGCCPRASRRRP